MESDSENSHQTIKISVTDPNNEGTSYVTYLVNGSDKSGQFSIRRRFNDFFALKQAMVQRWLGIYLPPIASKKIAGNKQEKFVEERKRFFHYFCTKISERPYLFYSEEFQLFLRGQGEFLINVKKLPPVNLQAQLAIYKQSFSKYMGKLSSAELLLMNETDYDYLKKAEKKFDQIRQQFKEVAQAKQSYANQFVHVFGTVLPSYEEKFLLNHVGKDREKLIMSNETSKEKLQEYQGLANNNSLEDYVEMISYELREARSLIEAVETRKKAEEKKIKMQKKRKDSQEQLQKLQSGKSTMKSVFSSGSKEQLIEGLQQEISQLEEDISSLNEMIPLMNAAGNHEIKEYKTKRGKEYVNVLKSVAEKEIKELSVYGKVLRIPLEQLENQK